MSSRRDSLPSILERRRFLHQFGLLLAAMAIAPVGRRLLAGEHHDGVYDCIVLGAGMAGVTAARRLADQRLDGKPLRILVLEGSNRIGGRIHTVRGAFDGPIELGAEYVHREPRSVPIWEDIERYRLKTFGLNKMNDSLLSYARGWDAVPAGKYWKVLEAKKAANKWGLWKAATLFQKMLTYHGPDRSVGDWLPKEELDRAFREMPILGHMPGLAQDMSMKAYVADRYPYQLAEVHEYYIEEGYDRLPALMAEGLDIRFGQIVENISYSPAGVEIQVRGGRCYRARTAICTFSIGMLKSGEVSFSPGLPEKKLLALSGIEPGHHTKVSIRFDQKFWPRKMSMLNRLDSARRAGRTYFHVLPKDPRQPAILNALIMGADAQKLRLLDDQEVLWKICSDLTEIFPELGWGGVLKLVSKKRDGSPMMLRKQWMDDPFAKGGNAYITVEKEGGLDVRQLRKCLADHRETPSLYWAGEATEFHTQPASVHGAHSSGLRAAKQTFGALRRRTN